MTCKHIDKHFRLDDYVKHYFRSYFDVIEEPLDSDYFFCFMREEPALMNKLWVKKIPMTLRLDQTYPPEYHDIKMMDTYKYASNIIWQSAFTKNVGEQNGYKQKENDIIVNGTNPDLFYPILDKSEFNEQDFDKEVWDFRPGTIKIVTSASWRKEKKLMRILELIKALPDNFSLILVGGSHPSEKNNFPQLKKMMDEVNSLNNTLLLGMIEHNRLGKVLRSCDIYFHSSQKEGCANSSIEALRCGLPNIFCYNNGVTGFNDYVNLELDCYYNAKTSVFHYWDVYDFNKEYSDTINAVPDMKNCVFTTANKLQDREYRQKLYNRALEDRFNINEMIRRYYQVVINKNERDNRRIGHFIDNVIYGGGGEKISVDLLKHSSHKDDYITMKIWDDRKGDLYVNELKANGNNVFVCDTENDLFAKFKEYEMIVFHYFGNKAHHNLLKKYMQEKDRSKVLTICHTDFFRLNSTITRDYGRMTKVSDYMLCYPHEYKEWLKYYSKNELDTFKIGVDLGGNESRLELKKKYKRKSLTILQIGSIRDIKNQLYTLQIVKEMKNQGIKNPFVIFAGLSFNSDYQNILDEYIKTNKLKSNVKFLGNINHEELAEYIDFSDVVLHPSKNESYSITILEVLSRGKKPFVNKHLQHIDFIGKYCNLINLDEAVQEGCRKILMNIGFSKDDNLKEIISNEYNEHALYHLIDEKIRGFCKKNFFERKEEPKIEQIASNAKPKLKPVQEVKFEPESNMVVLGIITNSTDRKFYQGLCELSKRRSDIVIFCNFPRRIFDKGASSMRGRININQFYFGKSENEILKESKWVFISPDKESEVNKIVKIGTKIFCDDLEMYERNSKVVNYVNNIVNVCNKLNDYDRDSVKKLAK